MSEQPDRTELLRGMYLRKTLDEWVEPLHPEAELHQAREIPDSDSYYGREEIIRGISLWLEEWERFRFLPAEVIDCGGDRWFMRIHLTGKAKASGLPIESDVFHVWTFRDGAPWRCDIFWDEAEARALAGLAD